MANVRVRPYSIFANGKKLGQMYQSGYKIMSGDEPQFGDGGFQGYSDGAAQTTLDATTFQPAGKQIDFDFAGAVLSKTDVDIAIPIGPNIYMQTMRVLTAEYDTDQKTGKLDGKFTFGGGEPSRS